MTIRRRTWAAWAAVPILAALLGVMIWGNRAGGGLPARSGEALPPRASLRSSVPEPTGRETISRRDRLERRLADLSASDLDESDKAEVTRALKDALRIEAEAEEALQADSADRIPSAREDPEVRRFWEERRKAKPEKKEVRLRLEALLERDQLLAGQPVIVNLKVTNDGEEAVRLTTHFSLDQGDVSMHLQRPGRDSFERWRPPLLIGCIGTIPAQPELRPGQSLSLQADVSCTVARGTAYPGRYAIRFELATRGLTPAPLVTADLPFIAIAPDGGDGQVLRTILSQGLEGFLGTRAAHLLYGVDGPTILRRIGDAALLARTYPQSPYARDLRIGIVTVLLEYRYDVARTRAEWPAVEALARQALEAAARDLPTAWPRAESLLIWADCARKYRLDGERGALARFLELCPTDVRGDLARRRLQARPP